MNDTSPEIESRLNKMIMKKSGQQRWRMGFSMFNMARKQVLASLVRDHPHLNIRETRRGLFLCFYGQDFSHEEKERILKRIGLWKG